MPEFNPEPACRRFDEIQKQDPRMVSLSGHDHPREYLHSLKMRDWLEKLRPDAPDALRLAARANALKRWEIPRDAYPRTTTGYHQWRRALRAHHAKIAAEILTKEGAGADLVAAVTDLILMKKFPADPNAQTLEDADCLTFLETKFHDYIPQWDEAKTIRILKGTISKMSPRAVELAKTLALSPDALRLINKALSETA